MVFPWFIWSSGNRLKKSKEVFIEYILIKTTSMWSLEPRVRPGPNFTFDLCANVQTERTILQACLIDEIA
jgi:hypothetical protein